MAIFDDVRLLEDTYNIFVIAGLFFSFVARWLYAHYDKEKHEGHSTLTKKYREDIGPITTAKSFHVLAIMMYGVVLFGSGVLVLIGEDGTGTVFENDFTGQFWLAMLFFGLIVMEMMRLYHLTYKEHFKGFFG